MKIIPLADRVVIKTVEAEETTKLTRGYRQPCYVDSTNAATLKRMLPYG